jgi:hypothetical protein
MMRFILFGLAFCALASSAYAQTRDVCVRIRTNFDDPLYGDFMTGNPSNGFPARYVEVEVTTSSGTTTHNLAGNGCATLPVPVGTDPTWTLTVNSRARRQNVDMIAWSEPALAVGVPYVESRAFSISAKESSVTREVSPHQTFENLAVLVWAIHRNRFGLGTHSARGCCYNPGALTDDGLCSGSNTDAYADWPTGSPLELEVVTTLHDPECCGSQWDPLVNPVTRTAVRMGNNQRKRWIVAHELGHVIVMERMGKRSRTNQEASLWRSGIGMDLVTEQCMGHWRTPAVNDLDPLGSLFVDPLYPDARSDWHGSDKKAPLSLEYQSAAAREGWADFYASWLFNKRVESDCVFDSHNLHDLDLDGDIDTNYGDEDQGFTEERDGVIDCEGGGAGAGDPFPLTDPLSSTVTARDWLADMVNSNSCVAPYSLNNRASQYDWHRYWWDMTTDEGVVPQTLADVYVDMCPTNWNSRDSGPADGRVRRRIELSTSFHLLSTEHLTQRDNGVDR